MHKTYSSPNLQGKTNRYSRGTQHDKYEDENDNDDYISPQFVIGDRVLVDKYRAGSVAFFGELDFSSGDWVGVVLDEPSGNHDGKIHGREYFHCAPQHGLFVRPSRLRKISSSRPTSPAIGSRLRQSRSSLQSPSTMSQASSNSQYTPANSGRSTTESYYYDDDYRNYPSRPTIESLERKLRSINATSSSSSKNNKNNCSRPRAQSVSAAPARQQLSPSSSKSVFNFRPQRIRVDDYARESPEVVSLGRTPSSHSMGKLLDFSNNKPLHLHDRILVKSVERQCELTGTLRFLGQTDFATGEWAGVELDEPEGRNDGTVLGVRYFRCPENYGLFVPASRVSPLSPKADFARTVKSTIKSPPPPPTRSQSQNSMESPASTINNSPSQTSTPDCQRYDDASKKIQDFHREHHDISMYPSRAYGDKAKNVDAAPNRSVSSAYSSSNLSSSSSPATTTTTSTRFKEIDLDDALKRYTTHRRPKLIGSNYNDHYYYSNNDSSAHFDANSQIRDNRSTASCNHRLQPRSIKYTFRSSKYDGNPIALKTVQYDDDYDPI